MGWATRDDFAWFGESFSILSPLFQASETLVLGLNHAAIIIATMLLSSLLLSSVIVRLVWQASSARAGRRKRFQ